MNEQNPSVANPSHLCHISKIIGLYLEIYFISTWVIYTYTTRFIGCISWNMHFFIIYPASMDLDVFLHKKLPKASSILTLSSKESSQGNYFTSHFKLRTNYLNSVKSR